MILRPVTGAVMFFCVAVAALAQDRILLADFEGSWVLDGERSFSKSERGDVSNYELKVSQSGDTLKFFWDYTIKKKRSHYSQTLVVDGERHDAADYGGMAAGARAYSARIKGSRIKQSMSYGAYMPRSGSYMDSRTLSLSKDKTTLTIETLFISALPGDVRNRGNQKLVSPEKGFSPSAATANGRCSKSPMWSFEILNEVLSSRHSTTSRPY